VSTTRLLKIDPAQPDPAGLAQAAECLRSGGLVAFPTETVYGLGANALDPAAVRRIFQAKGRPTTDPLIVHLHDSGQLGTVAAAVPELALKLAEAFWPGPLTLILPRAPGVPAEVTAGGPTVAVRVPRHPVAQALLAAAGLPIAAPSANRFARPSPTTAQHVLDDLEGKVELVLDGGPVTIGLESTIVDVTQDPPQVLRPGGLPVEVIRRVAPDCTVRARYLELAAERAEAPGQFLKHYAPRAALHLFDGPREAVLAAMRARALAETGHQVGVLAVDEDAERWAGWPVVVARLGPAAEPEIVGRRLFAALRDLDSSGVSVILARLPERAGLGLAIWDRLFRAAEGRVTRIAVAD